MSDDPSGSWIGSDGEFNEPLPVPRKGVHWIWFVLAGITGLALVLGAARVLDRYDRQLIDAVVQDMDWPTAPPLPVREPPPTLAPIVPPGTRTSPITRQSAGKLALLGALDEPVDIFHFEDGRELIMFRGDQLVRRSLVFRSIANAAKMNNVFSLPVAFSPDPRLIATPGTKHQIWLWDVPYREVEQVLPPLRSTITALDFSGNGRILAGGDATGEILVWDVFTSTEQTRLRTGGAIRILKSDRNGDHLAVASAGYPFRVYVFSDELFWIELDFSSAVHAAAFDPYDRYLAYSVENRIHLFNLNDYNVSQNLDAHAHPVSALAFTANGQMLASGDDAGRIVVWDIASGTPLNTLETGHAVRHLEFDADRESSWTLAAMDETGIVRFWGVVETE